MEAAIRLQHITKTFTTQSTEVIIDHVRHPACTRTVIKDLSLTIPADTLTIIVGRSGCGKSTLLRLIHNDCSPDHGEVVIPDGWRTAMLSADPYVISWTSVLRNVAMAAGAGRTPEERMELAERLVEMVGLKEYADMTPMELSTGMKQRLGLARVLAGRSEILLLDEPFASLDFITREEMQRELLGIQNAMPRTIIMVTHQLEEALLLGQRILVMHEDSTVEEFDLTDIPYPRDTESPVMKKWKTVITQACRG